MLLLAVSSETVQQVLLPLGVAGILGLLLLLEHTWLRPKREKLLAETFERVNKANNKAHSECEGKFNTHISSLHELVKEERKARNNDIAAILRARDDQRGPET